MSIPLQFDDFALEYAGVRRDQFGADRHLPRRAAAQRARRRQLLGVSQGIPVVPAHSDGALNQIANCAAVVGRMTFSVGTSGAIRLTTDRPVLPEGHQLWSYLRRDGLDERRGCFRRLQLHRLVP